MPLNPESILAVSQAGQQLLALLPRRGEVFFGERQHRRHGRRGDFAARAGRAGPPASGGARRSRCRGGRRARGSTGPGPGGAGSGSRPPAVRCCGRPVRGSGRSWRTGAPGAAAGRPCPTIAPRSGPQNPPQDTTMSAGITPSAVVTPVTCPPLCSMPITFVEPWNTAPRACARRVSATTARDALARPSVSTYSPPRIRFGSSSGCSLAHSSGR